MSYRPQRMTGIDENHFLVRDFLRDRSGGFTPAPREVRGSTMAYTGNYRGYPYLLIDTSRYGGIFPDWYLEVEHLGTVWIEVKTAQAMKLKDHRLQQGETWMKENTTQKFWIVANEEALEIFLNEWMICQANHEKEQR